MRPHPPPATRLLPAADLLALAGCHGILLHGLQARIDAAPAGGALMLPAGDWSGDVVVRKPLTLRGDDGGGTRLSGNGTVTIAAHGVRLSSVHIDARESGIRVEPDADVAIDHVEVESVKVGLIVAARATAKIEDSHIKCAGSLKTSVGAHIEGRLEAARLTVSGTCRHGIEVRSGEAELHRVTVRDAAEASIHGIDAKLTLSDIESTGVRKGGSGLFGAHSRIDGETLRFSGGENGVLLRYPDAHLDGLTTEGCLMTGAAVVGGTLTLTHARFAGPYREAAISALPGSHVIASDVDVTDAGRLGVMAVAGRLDMRDTRVRGARYDSDGDFGHGFMLVRSTGTLTHVHVTDVDGAGVYGSDSDTSATVTSCEVRQAGAGVAAVLGARLEVSHLDVVESRLGVLASGGGHVRLADSTLDARIGLIACHGSNVSMGAGVVVKAREPTRPCRDPGEDVSRGALDAAAVP